MRGLLLTQDGFAPQAGALTSTLADASPFLELGETAQPTPGPGEVVIKVRRAAVNPSDTAFIQGVYGQPRVAGQPAGFEGVGKVVASGSGLMARRLRGKDVAFAVVPGGSGAWAEYAKTQALAAIPLIRGVKDRDAAGLIVNPLTAAAMLSLVRPGEAFVFSAAASQLGKLTASLARDQGKRMIALVRRDTPTDALKSLGATHVLNETAPGFAEELASILNSEKPRIFLDAVSGGSSPAVFKAMGTGARWVIYGKLDAAPCEIIEPGELIFLSKRVEGFWLSKWLQTASLWRKLRTIKAVQTRFRDGHWSTDIARELPLETAIADMGPALQQTDGKTQIILP